MIHLFTTTRYVSVSKTLALVPYYFLKKESLGLLQGDSVGLSTYRNALGTKGATETTKLTASEETEYGQSNLEQH